MEILPADVYQSFINMTFMQDRKTAIKLGLLRLCSNLAQGGFLMLWMKHKLIKGNPFCS